MAGGELENQGKLHLVDLAGSECAKKGGLIYPEELGELSMSFEMLVSLFR